jgi:nucleotide-binding universal stress UspA family protein
MTLTSSLATSRTSYIHFEMRTGQLPSQTGNLPALSQPTLRGMPPCLHHAPTPRFSRASLSSQWALTDKVVARAHIVTQAAQPDMAAQQPEQPSPPGPVAPPTRRIAFACDGTQHAQQGLRWIVRHVLRPGDVVHLTNVVADDRSPSTAVGSSPAATQWTSGGQGVSRDFLSRAENTARELLVSRFAPELQFAPGVEHSIDVLHLKAHKSAASIGRTLSDHAVAIKADMLVIASHGAGVQCEFGSVARWCSDNSAMPALLLPPAVLEPRGGSNPGNTTMVAAVEDMEGLRAAFNFAAERLARAGENVYLIHACQAGTEEQGVAARKALVASALTWQEELAARVPHVATLNVAVDIVTDSPSNAEAMSTAATKSIDGELTPPSPAGERLCQLAEDLNVRSVVFAHHGRHMIREMKFGPVTVHCTKLCQRPLVVLGSGSA